MDVEVDEDDPVLEEIPVLLSTKLVNQLYILQYPLHPASEGNDRTTFMKTWMKPENEEVRMELAIDTKSVRYNFNKGEFIASDVDESALEKDEEEVFNCYAMDKLLLRSSRAVPNCDNLAIGTFQNGQLHINPLKGIFQMRPQFNYLDKTDNLLDETQEYITEDEDAKHVNVAFGRSLPDFIKKLHEKSFQYHAQKSSEEQWIPTNYIPSTSAQAELTRLESLCSTSNDSGSCLKLSQEEYLNILAPPLKEEQFSKAIIPNHATSLSYIRTLPLSDQVRILMKDAKVMSFTQLQSILSSEYETSAILKYLQQVAALVQGNWVVNSELIYLKDSMSMRSDIPAELMCRARDYILLSFTEHEFIDRRGISSVIKLPAEEIRDIFMNLCKHHPKKGWKLIVPPSKDFSERFPEITHRQHLFWEAKRKHLRDIMARNQAPQRQRRKSNRESVGSENEEKNIVRGRKFSRSLSLLERPNIADTSKKRKRIDSRKQTKVKQALFEKI